MKKPNFKYAVYYYGALYEYCNTISEIDKFIYDFDLDIFNITVVRLK